MDQVVTTSKTNSELRQLLNLIDGGDLPPEGFATLNEICAELGCSYQTARARCDALVAKGQMVRKRYRSRNTSRQVYYYGLKQE